MPDSSTPRLTTEQIRALTDSLAHQLSGYLDPDASPVDVYTTIMSTITTAHGPQQEDSRG